MNAAMGLRRLPGCRTRVLVAVLVLFWPISLLADTPA